MLGLLAGCDAALYDFWGTRREEATNLLLRVENGDPAAYSKLVELSSLKTGGDPYAAAQLGYVHQVGLGGQQIDIARAKAEYAKTRGIIKEADYNAGLIELGLGQYEAAVERFALAAGGQERDGMTIAMVQMAMVYEAGRAGAPMSASLAAEWYEYAAAKGDLFAKTRFALILLQGKGRTQDIDRGTSLLEQAAVFGNREARIAMSAIHAKPMFPGVPVNRELAARWLLVGADGVPRLERAARDYFEALTPLERKAVQDSVTLFRMGHKGIVEPDDYTAPLRIQKAA
jgi:TPR repeat protein